MVRHNLTVLEIKAALGSGTLGTVLEQLEQAHPADAADILGTMAPDEAVEVLGRLDSETRADIFCEFSGAFQREVAELLDASALAILVAALSPDDRVDLLKSLSDERMAEALAGLDKSDREEANRLAAYPEGSSGSIMTTEFIALPGSLNAAQAMARIRAEAPEKESVYNAYIIDRRGRPLGVVNLRDLILAEPEALLRSIMDDQVPTVGAEGDREESIYTLTRYALIDLPVVDGKGVMVGIVTHDDAMLALERERTEDMERFMAIAGSHEDSSYLRTPIWSHFKHRLPWLVILAAFGLVSGAILQGFEDTLMNLMILAFYMPMLADTGGNTGSQAATVVVRALALKEISYTDAFRVLGKELKVALMLSLVLGFFALLRVLIFTSSSQLPPGMMVIAIALTIALALSIQVLSATVLGASLPLLAARFGADPALVASPALTTAVDITGLLIYFGTARLLLGV